MNAVIAGGWKYVRTTSGPDVREELYDLRADAGERHDLAGRETDRRDVLRERWLAFERDAPRWQAETERLDVSAEQAERLRELGYADDPLKSDP